jgi:hypothetical protein
MRVWTDVRHRTILEGAWAGHWMKKMKCMEGSCYGLNAADRGGYWIVDGWVASCCSSGVEGWYGRYVDGRVECDSQRYEVARFYSKSLKRRDAFKGGIKWWEE